ncbi:FIP1[V]-like protein isoform X2 [Syzygium oleosum]|uniref:FIP1[V]-like protein isoform X2 n=1 Tax=Syzygium oleosum TaxID=219896 RepID=UPI0024B94062|nr:FIP1[V]-like protein isoform X2 [Syzygium oleosum]
MDDDDEFGDLYTDVLKPFASSSSSSSAAAAPAPQPPPLTSPEPPAAAPPPPPPPRRPPIDLNLKTSVPAGAGDGAEEEEEDDDDGATLFGARRRGDPPPPSRALSLSLNSVKNESAGSGDADLPARVLDPPPGEKSDARRGAGGGSGSRDLDSMDADVKFDIEENNEHGMEDPVIPGLSGPREPSGARDGNGGDDWDSDSEDDLQIVLNDNTAHHGPMGAIGDAGGEDDDDEDGDPLVIVADGDPNQPLVEQEWGEDTAEAGPDGERKEGGGSGELAKANGGVGVAPKIGYSNLGYHPFHSQFKYVRPGASPMPGSSVAAPIGAPGQVRPPVAMGPLAGRGRGDWRLAGMKNASSLQKNYHPGTTPWGSGRGYGGGLEFSLPSHKTIFEVDIDSFEEKPWRYPGVDSTDFFNFSLNEESWKEYCKQLETLRLESTMQSKIHVYESGRKKQEFDPDLPPELAAASGIHDITAENMTNGKLDAGQSGSKASAHVRPSLPTGRAIQVESGYGERLPSIDTRPPRIRDSDAIIEIVCQDSVDDDSSTENGPTDRVDNNDPTNEDLRGVEKAEDRVAREEADYFDRYSETYSDQNREVVGKAQIVESGQDDLPGGEESSPLGCEGSVQHHPSSSEQTSGYPNRKAAITHNERHMEGRARDQSPNMSPYHSTEDKKATEDQGAQMVDSVESEETLHVSSMDHKDALAGKSLPGDRSSELERNEVPSDASKAGEKLLHPRKKDKFNSRGEQVVLNEFDEGEDSRAARSSENSKARSGSSRDSQKWRDGTEEEVVQVGLPTHMGGSRRHLDENEQKFRRKDHDRRQETERGRTVVKDKVDPYRDRDPSLVHNLPAKSDNFDRRKEREYSDGARRLRDDEPSSRRLRLEDSRKRERSDEIGSRHRSRGRETERNDKEDYHSSKKQLDNGIYKVNYDKEVALRGRERDDSLRSRYEVADEYRSKRKKADEYFPRERDHIDKEEILRDQRDSSGRRKRDRDDINDQRQREDQSRVRDSMDDHHSSRHKDESWSQREKIEKQRDREEWPKAKQVHEENRLKREREEERAAIRGGRGGEEKAWAGQDRPKDDHRASGRDYQFKDTARQNEHAKRREHQEDESFLQYRGHEEVPARSNQIKNEERRSRFEKSSTRSDKPASVSDNQRMHEKKHSHRKNKEPEGGDHHTSKRNQDDHVSQMGTADPGTMQQFHSSREMREDMSSEDEQSESRRGRSKLERWTSHTERDYSINSKSSSSLRFKEVGRSNNNIVSSEASKLPESVKRSEEVDKHHFLAEDNDLGDVEKKDADTKPLNDRHLDTVEKLKKRSERFKLPMPIEKEASSIKKMESEAIVSTKGETPVDPEIKQERPARKRRWTSN